MIVARLMVGDGVLGTVDELVQTQPKVQFRITEGYVEAVSDWKSEEVRSLDPLEADVIGSTRTVTLHETPANASQCRSFIMGYVS